MKLYVMRHGAAEDAAASPNDFDRALTMKGRKRTREVGQTLAAENESPDVIISSPLVRAIQTAEIVAAVIDPPEPVVIRQELAPEGNAAALVLELAKNGTRSVLLVGHEPGLSELMYALIGEATWVKGFTKSMVAGVKVDEAGAAKLRWILDSKVLRLIPHR